MPGQAEQIRLKKALRRNGNPAVVSAAVSSGTVTWTTLTGKPSTFDPSAHAHVISEVSGLQTALDGKQASGSYSLTSHNHDATYALISHTHTIANVTGLQTALDGKQAAGSYAAASHSHVIADVTGLQTALDGKAATSHTHTIANITGLQTALDGKQPSGSYLTANQTITLSGDASGSGTTAISVTLATVNSNVGTFGNSTNVPVITVDGKGRITAASTVAVSGGGGGSVRTIYRLASVHSNNTVTPTTIGSTGADTDWVHTLVANKVYRFTVLATYQTAALTTGGRMNLLGAGGLAGSVAGMMWGGIQQAAAASTLEVPIWSFANGTGAFLLTTAVAPINSPHVWGADFVFVCTTGGTLALQWASEVATSAAQLNIGAVLMVEEIA